MSEGSTAPARGFTFLAGEVRRDGQFPRSEVEGALTRYQEIAARAVESGDWNPWAEQFTDDAIYVEHHFGVMRGRDEIRNWINATMQGPNADIDFPVLWYLIDNDLVFMYCPNRLRAPDGGQPFQFICGTVLCYAGDGRWCYEEDIYNAAEAARVAELSQRCTAETAES
jgi:ketosteroid isomerase-like protein